MLGSNVMQGTCIPSLVLIDHSMTKLYSGQAIEEIRKHLHKGQQLFRKLNLDKPIKYTCVRVYKDVLYDKNLVGIA